MRLAVWIPLLLAVAALLAACGGGDDDASPTAPPAIALDEPITVVLQEVNASGQSGTATLTAGADESIDVVLEIEGPNGQHAHIHDVTCAKYASMNDFDAQLATVRETLADLAGGTSETQVTVLDGGLPARTTGSYSINVHEKPPPYDAVACGDIPKR
jgi:hypothetical protein